MMYYDPCVMALTGGPVAHSVEKVISILVEQGIVPHGNAKLDEVDAHFHIIVRIPDKKNPDYQMTLFDNKPNSSDITCKVYADNLWSIAKKPNSKQNDEDCFSGYGVNVSGVMVTCTTPVHNGYDCLALESTIAAACYHMSLRCEHARGVERIRRSAL